MLFRVLLETQQVEEPFKNGTGPVACGQAGNILGGGTSLEHAVTQFETSVVVGEAQRVFLAGILLEAVMHLHAVFTDDIRVDAP